VQKLVHDHLGLERGRFSEKVGFEGEPAVGGAARPLAPHGSKVDLIGLGPDSAYPINGMRQRWHLRWEQYGWKTANKKPVKNADLWEELLRVSTPDTVTWVKVKGHSGVAANERCHNLVRLAIKKSFGDR
jgi:ribonuclease HI